MQIIDVFFLFYIVYMRFFNTSFCRRNDDCNVLLFIAFLLGFMRLALNFFLYTFIAKKGPEVNSWR